MSKKEPMNLKPIRKQDKITLISIAMSKDRKSNRKSLGNSKNSSAELEKTIINMWLHLRTISLQLKPLGKCVMSRVSFRKTNSLPKKRKDRGETLSSKICKN